MTLDEKVGIITGKGQFNSTSSLPARRCSSLSKKNANKNNPGRCIGDTHEVTRLGIPALCMNDGPAGIRAAKQVTGFPAGINAASTYVTELLRYGLRTLIPMTFPGSVGG